MRTKAEYVQSILESLAAHPERVRFLMPTQLALVQRAISQLSEDELIAIGPLLVDPKVVGIIGADPFAGMMA